ncbi:SMP-30/gluconolactonase/LRE family protein [Shinella sp. BYT-45]|uniref:SMP-30/gluconolactonase/LRE family protein n=1 Tax=Shinella sp. BYT-45 TaxID=3377377 RepID=UPI00397F780A
MADVHIHAIDRQVHDILGESPVWSDGEQALYWVDIRAPALHRLDGRSGEARSFAMPALVGAVLLDAQPGFVIVGLPDGLYRFGLATASLTLLLPLDRASPDIRVNDSRTHAGGGIVYSTMWDHGARRAGGIFLARTDRTGSLTSTPLATDMTVPNAICFSPDGGTLYFADSAEGTIHAARFTGNHIEAQATYAPANAAPGKPDGATVDSEGFLWNARYGGGCLARFAPDGRLDRVISLPVSQPTSCAFGGPGLRTLFVTTASQKLSDRQRAAEPLAGCLLALDVGVSGLPEPSVPYVQERARP